MKYAFCKKKHAVIFDNVGYFVKTSLTSKSGCLLKKFWNQTGQKFGLLEADFGAKKGKLPSHEKSLTTPKKEV